ncbi:hypothetical protein, partial [Cupriavidus nantongensis]
MSYQELIAKALNGRSVNRAAKDFGVPQKTFDRYTKGERLPDYHTALMLAQAAGIDPGEAFLMLAEEEAKRAGVQKRPSPPNKKLPARPPAGNNSVVK